MNSARYVFKPDTAYSTVINDLSLKLFKYVITKVWQTYSSHTGGAELIATVTEVKYQTINNMLADTKTNEASDRIENFMMLNFGEVRCKLHIKDIYLHNSNLVIMVDF